MIAKNHNAPCYKNGKDCSDRQSGCHGKCDDYKEWCLGAPRTNKQYTEADHFLSDSAARGKFTALTKGRTKV